MQERLSTSLGARKLGSVLSGAIFSRPVACAISVNRFQASVCQRNFVDFNPGWMGVASRAVATRVENSACRSTSSVSPLGNHFRFADLDLVGTAAEPGSEKIGRHLNLSRLPGRTFPDRCHAPSGREQCAARGVVPHHIRHELRLPEFRAGGWDGGVAAARMAMPEAAMYENDCPVLRKYEIRSTRKALRVQLVAEASGMHRAAKSHFGPRVLASDPGHHPGTGLLVDDVCHMAPGA